MNELLSLLRFKIIDHPAQLVYFVTKRCNAKCKFCFYTSENTPELNINQIEKISKTISPLHWVLISGGEPFIRNDIDEIAILFNKNANAKYIQIPTNGFLVDKILHKTENILNACPNLKLVISVSIDAIGKKHDEMRQLKNCYKNAIETVSNLLKLKKKYKNLGTAINMTFSYFNQKSSFADLKFLSENFNVDNITFGLVRGETLYKKAKDVDLALYKKVSDYIMESRNNYLFYNSFTSKLANLKDIIQREMVTKITQEKKMPLNCLAGIKSIVMYENGDIYPCEMLNKKLGNIASFGFDFRKFWNSKEAINFRKWRKNCYCTYECALSVSIIFSFSQFLRILKRLFWRLNIS